MRSRLVYVILVSMLAVNCASKLPPSTSTEAKLAIRGNQVVEGLRAVIPVVKQNVCSPTRPAPCINPDDAVTIFSALGKAGTAAEQLATALSVVDTATSPTDQASALEKARAYVKMISDVIASVQIVPGDLSARQALVSILAGVTSILLSIG